MAIKYLKISGNTECFTIDDGNPIECTPSQAIKPCVPQDHFDMIEECKVCGKKF
ncbi:hypothetical protein CJ739_108 [Mariniflexile rhizosphaerae]|nr:hypothetical protein CJ739_108 [Mariniflexile sp. TRM1-10]